MPVKGRKPKTPKVLAKVPDTDSLKGPNPTVTERVHNSFMQLLTWAEGSVTRIAAGELEVGSSLLDSLVKSLTTCGKELPRLEAEISKARAKARAKSVEEAGPRQADTDPGDDDYYTGLTDKDVAEFEAILEARDVPQVDDTPPMLETPKF